MVDGVDMELASFFDAHSLASEVIGAHRDGIGFIVPKQP